ncbi:hypothetical protein PAI11_37610 [Patulibacter medicamentivorans]|uniref:Uncharacterized protein n=1 Tax=Patulibacter medicamentivorans TaxID=1097667 RepID=H0EA87_9ACTN|nr:hypothetical protein [Patulibacter medicamentivorans]EHN09427.1 hypothetical protein PAI11_37610 [Patulibacter medicamentivorans]
MATKKPALSLRPLGPPSAAKAATTPADPVAPAAIRGRVTLWAPEAAITLIVRYSAAPQVTAETAASGAWEDVRRPRLPPLTNWVGPQPLQVELPLLIDGWLEQRSIDEELRTLRYLGMPIEVPGAPSRPPWLRVIGVMPAIPVPTAQRWVVDNLQIQEGKERIAGRCARATATVTLKPYRPSDLRTQLSRSETAKKKHSKPWTKGDTLAKFTRRHLGTCDAWARAEIRKANPSVKAWTKVAVGKQIVVPRLGIEFGPTGVGSLVRGG